MKFLMATLLALSAATAAAAADDAVTYSGDQSGTFNVWGVTSATTWGNVGGIGNMHRMCQAEFGPTARLCKSTEVKDSPTLVRVVDQARPFHAWVQPELLTREVVYFAKFDQWMAIATDASDFIVVEFSDFPNAAVFKTEVACEDWQSALAGERGMALQVAGETEGAVRLVEASCENTLPLLCCRPGGANTAVSQ